MHEEMFNQYILGEPRWVTVGYTPYYNMSLFERIRELKDNTEGDITVMLVKDFYKHLLHVNVLKDDSLGLLPLRIENTIPHLDWTLA